MDTMMDVSMESSFGSSCILTNQTPEKKKFPRPRSKIMTPTMILEDSGYLSGSHDSVPSHSRGRTSWQQKELLRSPEDLYWCSIMPEHMSKPSSSLVGLKHVDLLVRLRTFPHVLQKVLSELCPDDLVRCCLVSKAWNQACKLDSRATSRRRAYLSCKGLKNKENLGLPDACMTGKLGSCLDFPRLFSSTPLAPITASRQLNFCRTPLSSHDSPPRASSPRGKDRFSVFVAAGQKLTPGKVQMPCPRCSLPSRVDRDIHMGQCSQPQCRFQFCLMCLCEQHIKTPCPVTQLAAVRSKWPRSLTSRGSRRNLRRL